MLYNLRLLRKREKFSTQYPFYAKLTSVCHQRSYFSILIQIYKQNKDKNYNLKSGSALDQVPLTKWMSTELV